MREEDILDSLNSLQLDENENYYKLPKYLKGALTDYFGREVVIKRQDQK